MPDYHFLLIASNLGAEWFFDAARAYWERYRPIVVSDLELIRIIPEDNAIIVTVIARRDTASEWGVAVARVVPHALFDPVIKDYFEELRITLDDRVNLNQPFGVPLVPSPVPATPISPTPGALVIGEPVATRPPGGFITLTPSPTTGAPAEATPAPPPQETPSGPIYPTPGPITGGG